MCMYQISLKLKKNNEGLFIYEIIVCTKRIEVVEVFPTMKRDHNTITDLSNAFRSDYFHNYYTAKICF